jgi:hypothetical protein
MFGIDLFKKAKNIPEEMINEVVKNGVVKLLISQINEAHDSVNFVKNEMIDMQRKVHFLHELEKNKSNLLPWLHFLTTIGLLVVVVSDKFA